MAFVQLYHQGGSSDGTRGGHSHHAPGQEPDGIQVVSA